MKHQAFDSCLPVSEKRRRVRNVNDPTGGSGRKSSRYRGVTRHKATGRFEAHLWDKTSWNSIRKVRGKQSAYDVEENAARACDLAALKYWGQSAILNFPIQMYGKEIEEMQGVNKEMYLASLKRQSSGFSRGSSKYRGVARHHHNGRWEARIGLVRGKKYIYLGTYDTQEEAAIAYDMAAIEIRGQNAVTNFEISNYAMKLNNSPAQVIEKSKVNTTELVQNLHSNHQDTSSNSAQIELDSLISQDINKVNNWDGLEWDRLLNNTFEITSFSDSLMMEETSKFYDIKGFNDDIQHTFDWAFGDQRVTNFNMDTYVESTGLENMEDNNKQPTMNDEQQTYGSELGSMDSFASQGVIEMVGWNDLEWDPWLDNTFEISSFTNVMMMEEATNCNELEAIFGSKKISVFK